MMCDSENKEKRNLRSETRERGASRLICTSNGALRFGLVGGDVKWSERTCRGYESLARESVAMFALAEIDFLEHHS